jgi:methylenetetrahydrofolate reductase (NADPH)
MIAEIYRSTSKPVLSLELFPPKTERGETDLYENVQRLMQFQPAFITCTYGAGGSTRGKTLEIVSQVKQRFQIPVASHLTLVGSSVDDLRDYLRSAQQHGVDAIVALRGDPPAGSDEFEIAEGGLRYANELVGLIDSEFPSFGILVAGYPEKHREAISLDVDLDNLKRKVDAGADAIITQLFYNNDDFFRFQDLCQRNGIRIPIVPGLLPVTGLKQVERITTLSNAKLPEEFYRRLAEKDDPAWHLQVGVEKTIEQVQGLLTHGVAGLHFYILNRSDATTRVLESLDSSLTQQVRK